MTNAFRFLKASTSREALIDPEHIVLKIRKTDYKPNQSIEPEHRLVPIATRTKVKKGCRVVVWGGIARNLEEAYHECIFKARKIITDEKDFASYYESFLTFEKHFGFSDPKTNLMNQHGPEDFYKSTSLKDAIMMILQNCEELARGLN
ncbi:MAG: hypothetical protein GY793_07100 [Proteobacteria bacterium]|nr:hypothetical protein [Pseudomonadota bacterium]